MSSLGYVKQVGENRYQGRLTLIGFSADIQLRPLEDARGANAPDMEIVAGGGVPIGSARNKVGKTSGKPYVALAIRHPQIAGTQAQPIFANLGPANDVDEEDVLAIIA